MTILPTHLLQTANGFLHPTVPHFSLKCSSAWAVVFHPHPHTTYHKLSRQAKQHSWNAIVTNSTQRRTATHGQPSLTTLLRSVHIHTCRVHVCTREMTVLYIIHGWCALTASHCSVSRAHQPHDSAATRTHTYTHALQTTTTYAFLAHYARTAKPHQRSAASIESEISIAMQSLVCTYILHETTYVSQTDKS